LFVATGDADESLPVIRQGLRRKDGPMEIKCRYKKMKDFKLTGIVII